MRASINWALMCSQAPVLRTLPSKRGICLLISDLTRLLLIPISHHAGSADDLEIGNLRQFGQKSSWTPPKAASSLSLVRFSNGSMRFKLLQDGGTGQVFQTITTTGTIRASDNTTIPATVGFRCSHFFPPPNTPLASIGSCLSHVPGLRPTPEQKNNGAVDLFRDISGNGN